MDPLPPDVPSPEPPDTDEDTDQNRCLQQAAETAPNLPAYAWGIYTARQAPGGPFHVGAERNVATSTYCINGSYGIVGAVSGARDRPGLNLVPTPSSPAIPAFPPGENDAEWKIVNQLYAVFGVATTPSIDFLYSQFAICPSCASAIQDYERLSGVPVFAWDSGFVREEFVRRFGNLR